MTVSYLFYGDDGLEKKIYVIRHCEAEGQPKEAPLTENGIQQAVDLAGFFVDVKINRIISSPFLRAIQSIERVAKRAKVNIEVDERLAERILSAKMLPDWLEKLKATFDDLDLRFDRGESSREAMDRIVGVVEEIFKSDSENNLIVTHGNLMSLLIKNYLPDFGYEEWRQLSNPDVYLLKLTNKEFTFERLSTEK
ncbi:histidine phosphatase family protein [Neobacillus sp. OS1-33]|jgi:2,3-bisphosphoglycerate-dependent phosphoglycerate mutase|uniref:histidine phosphatase family protein n=1 Tax=Neobacillus sp. OS1-33 TaxID=3070683 RepID=UPI0027E19D2E|nr:histidine phosphatase family protein [Neobacillus sp. OS1-33]WML24012.1 histidine phosphatase family protein [Neobacillus sp. OS1-33]